MRQKHPDSIRTLPHDRDHSPPNTIPHSLREREYNACLLRNSRQNTSTRTALTLFLTTGRCRRPGSGHQSIKKKIMIAPAIGTSGKRLGNKAKLHSARRQQQLGLSQQISSDATAGIPQIDQRTQLPGYVRKLNKAIWMTLRPVSRNTPAIPTAKVQRSYSDELNYSTLTYISYTGRWHRQPFEPRFTTGNLLEEERNVYT